jgi:hypothetical protein
MIDRNERSGSACAGSRGKQGVAVDGKDILTLGMSAVAFVFSVMSFGFTFHQRDVENRRATRKSLTDIISELSKVRIAYSQLELDHPNSSDERVISFRRSYYDQRRYLANHGEFLAQEIPHLVTDVDAVILASAFSSIDDYERAERFYMLSIEKSPNNLIRMNNTRTFAVFWFRRGNAARGRVLFEQALQLEVPTMIVPANL